MPDRMTRLSPPIRNRKQAETIVPNDRAELLNARAAVQDLAENELLRDDDPDAHRHDHAGVTEREEVAEAEGPRLAGALPLLHLLARGVVDHGDVVGVEGVPQAEGVGQHADADPEAAIVRRYHERDEDAEAGRCRTKIEAYMSDTRRRSTGVIAENDWPIIAGPGLGVVVTADTRLLLSRLPLAR